MKEAAGDIWGPTRSPPQGRGRSAAGTPEVGASCIFAYCPSHVSPAGGGVCPAHPHRHREDRCWPGQQLLRSHKLLALFANEETEILALHLELTEPVTVTIMATVVTRMTVTLTRFLPIAQ